MTTTRTAPALLALACAVGLLATPLSPSAAAVARCDGRVPTILTTDHRVTGTPGDDVIVVLARRASVEAGTGDDRICVRGRAGWTTVRGDAGDDRVRVEVRTSVFADLSDGTDTYRGGPGTDLVATGMTGERNLDRVLLGGGDDTLVLAEGRDHRRAVLRGGAGEDLLEVRRRGGALMVDAGAGRATLEGRTYARWSSFASHHLSSAGRKTFVGSAGPDDVSFGGRGAVEARTGEGDDAVELRYDPWDVATVLRDPASHGRHAPSYLLDLGAGRDRLEVSTSVTSVVGDLTTGTIWFSGTDGPLGSFSFTGVEDLSVDAPVHAEADSPSQVELVGDDLDNQLRASACRVVLRGAGGDDRLQVGALPRDGVLITAGGLDKGCPRRSFVYGGPGDDAMTSRVTFYDFRGLDVGDHATEEELPAPDLLDGGEGVDTADAGAGRDTCLAETRVDCEA